MEKTHTHTKEVNQLVTESTKGNGKFIDYARTFNSDKALQVFYKNYGYITIKNIIPSTLIGDIQNELINIFRPFATDKNYSIDSSIIQLDKSDKAKLYELHIAASKATSFKAVSVHLSKVLKKISGSEAPVLEIAAGFLLGIPKDKRLVYDYHQESNYMKGFEDIFNIHYPLFRTSTIENGTMSILPSSHNYGTLTFEKKRISQDSYTDLVPSGVEAITSKLPELHCQLELGDCVIFHKDLIHKSNFNSSNLCRLAGVSRFTQSLVGDWLNRKPEEL
jgi:hypothetical protein